MIYGYVRVSTDRQTADNQRYEIEQFCARNGLAIESWIEETISGATQPQDRRLGLLLQKARRDDLIVCSELSRLGRSLFMIMSILNQLMLNGVRVWTIKDNYRLGDNIQSKVLAFAFGISAEIERELISRRTKEALERRKAQGTILGRPRGKKPSRVKLSGRENEIRELLEKKISKSAIARLLGVHRATVDLFIRERLAAENGECVPRILS
jgi:DNA invertase Pin-like site-specific DNA recombinase